LENDKKVKELENKEKAEDYLIAEFNYLTNSISESEEIGNTRINYFITLTTAILGAIGLSNLLSNKIDITNQSIFFLVGLIILFFYGQVTFQRIVQRNLQTDDLKIKCNEIRRYFSRNYNPILPAIPFKSKDETEVELPQKVRDARFDKWPNPLTFGSGGLAQTIALINSFIFGIMIGLSSVLISKVFLSIPLSVEVFEISGIFAAFTGFLIWLAQWSIADIKYRNKVKGKNKNEVNDKNKTAG
jgi:hypothetical protein